jgi:23S rRNA pseudouridine2605 synthase
MTRPEDEEKADLVRLNKYLADNGIASRRKADQLITAGEVMVDGKIVTTLGTKIDPFKQRVEVDGVVLKPEGVRHRYYLLNKPTGVVCTSDPREDRRRAIDMITDRKAGRIFTVGRLDEDSSGLILLTNDGDFANLVAHPRYEVPKLYKVVVRGRVEDEALSKARNGVRLSDCKASFESVILRKRGVRQTTLLVGLKEGRNRQIRRVFARLGHKVTDLARVRVGNLTDRGLKKGQWRPLLREEVEEMRGIARGEIEPRPVTQGGSRRRPPAKRRPGASGRRTRPKS